MRTTVASSAAITPPPSTGHWLTMSLRYLFGSTVHRSISARTVTSIAKSERQETSDI